MDPIFLHIWDSKEDMIASFENVFNKDELTQEQKDKYAHVEVLLASYGCDNYTGDAFVLFRNTKDGQLYENNGSHCSCFGLEDQWDEESTSIESLRKRVNQGSLGSDDYSGNVFKDELIKVLDELEGIKPMVRWVKVPAPGEMRGEGIWKKFNDVWPGGTHWDYIVETNFLPTKELAEGETPSD